MVGIPFPVCSPVARFPFATRHSWIQLLPPALGRCEAHPNPVSRFRLRVLLITNVHYPVLQGAGERFSPRPFFPVLVCFDY